MIIRAVAVLAAVAVVGCFFIALAHALPGPDAVVVVVADPAVTPGQRWFVRVLGVDPPRRAPFVGKVNGTAVDAHGLAQIERSPALEIDGVVGAVPLVLHVEVPLVPPPPTSTSTRPLIKAGAALLPLSDGSLRATLLTPAPEPGGDVVVDVTSSVPFAAELMVGGVTRAMADDRAVFPLPDDARPGELVVVRLAESALPSARGRTFVAFVKGEGAPADLERLVPQPAQTPVVSPSFEIQQHRRRATAGETTQRWRQRLRLLDGVLLIVVAGLALGRGRRTPVAAVGAVVVVALLLLALDAVLAFVVA